MARDIITKNQSEKIPGFLKNDDPVKTPQNKSRPPKSSYPWEKPSSRPRSSKTSLTIWIICSFTLILLFTGIWMFHSISDQKNESSPPLSNQSSGYDRYQTLDVPEDTLYDLPPLTVAKNFALSDSVREHLKWARKPEEITSRLPEYSEQALELPASSIRYLSQITLKSLIYETFVAEFADGSPRLLCVIGTPSGPKVDWDAYARYGNAS
ncbi:MAG: hypothetical protein QNK83_12750 [Akkermansiaceae bacterium]